jgi:hypothetical protein
MNCLRTAAKDAISGSLADVPSPRIIDMAAQHKALRTTILDPASCIQKMVHDVM